jgi:DnaK suppressor protein
MSHLNKKQLAELSQTLEVQRRQLRQDIREVLLRSNQEQYGELVGETHDSGDESVADLLSEVNNAALSQSIRALREVEAAQQRLQENHYGQCEDCDIEIPFERLKANPAARRCLEDQRRYEKLHDQDTATL